MTTTAALAATAPDGPGPVPAASRVPDRARRRRWGGPRSAAVVALVVALVLGACSSPATPRDLTAEVTVSGELPQLADAANDPAVGAPSPSGTGVDFDDVPQPFPVEGEATVLVFVAHWCPHCQAEVPRIVAAAEAGAIPEGVQVIGVSTAHDPNLANFPPQRWLDRERWPFPLIVDDAARTLAARFGLSGLPFMVFVDEDGNVAGRVAGALPDGGFEDLVAGFAANYVS